MSFGDRKRSAESARCWQATARRSNDGRAANARTIAAIRSADAPGSSQTVTASTMISGPVVPDKGAPPSSGAMTIAADASASCGAGKTSLPFRASVRHDDRWLELNP